MLTKRFEEALVYATRLHSQQRRKGKDIPYVSHLLAVTSLVLEHGGDEDQAIAALLHDAVEDQGGDTTRQEILQRFGQRVSAIVDDCTDGETIPKPPWRERKERYLAHLPSAQDDVLLVSAADKLHNVRCLVDDYRTLGEALWSRFRGRRDGTLWYYRSLIRIYEARGPAALAIELRRTLQELEEQMAARGDSAPADDA